MTAAEKLQTTEPVYDYPLDEIRDPSIPNYRTNLKGIEELTESVRERGIKVPLVLRPAPDGKGHELAIGARRREAAKRAGLTTVPVFIRELTDDEVHEERVVENLQRENPDPLDEAAAFAVLVKRGYSEQTVADRLGQPLRYVRERLALNGLCEDGRKALADGSIVLGVALLVAALPASIQPSAVEEVRPTWKHDVMTVHGARDAISKRVLLRLKDAPFNLRDSELVPSAGACTACAKHTGSQGNLFGATEDEGDCCLDSDCHKSKVDALWQLRVKHAKTEGQEVLTKKAAVEALRSTAASYGTGPYVRLDEKVYLGSNKARDLKKAFGDELPPITLARDENGAPVELVPRKAVETLLRASGKSSPDPKKADAKAKNEREAERLQAEVRRRVMVGLVEKVDNADGTSSEYMRIVLRAAVHSLPPDVRKAVANRRGCPLTVEQGEATAKKGKGKKQEVLDPAERLNRLIATLKLPQLHGLLLELVLYRAAPGKWSEAHEVYADACAELGVVPAVIEAAIKVEKKAKSGKALKPDPKPKPKKKPSKENQS